MNSITVVSHASPLIAYLTIDNIDLNESTQKGTQEMTAVTYFPTFGGRLSMKRSTRSVAPCLMRYNSRNGCDGNFPIIG